MSGQQHMGGLNGPAALAPTIAIVGRAREILFMMMCMSVRMSRRKY